jgi:hypothetical protein
VLQELKWRICVNKDPYDIYCFSVAKQKKYDSWNTHRWSVIEYIILIYIYISKKNTLNRIQEFKDTLTPPQIVSLILSSFFEELQLYRTNFLISDSISIPSKQA